MAKKSSWIIKDLNSCKEFTAGDGSQLRELLHPDKEALALRYSLAHARVAPGQKTKPHRLKASEVYYILEGKGKMFITGESREVGPGSAIYIPPDAVQCIQNTGDGDLIFICLVDPAWKAEYEQIISEEAIL